ncbi:unnamed protein product [Brassicogethes aeneus]|uniref:Rho-GAP domain-containing protein n=1 Tax=Brassicogethes aeneus TaxID=1431903 RepID=A0A9P0FG52_BRAAE|nr:unnamed protein product [Brassicogethes aeneus]
MTAYHQDVLNIVQAKFLSPEVVKCIHLNVSLVDAPWNTFYRLFALVECNKSFGLFVLISEKWRPESITDVSIERAIPIDQYFSCDTEVIPESQKYLFFIINYKEFEYKFLIQIGLESSNFASQVIYSKENSDSNKLLDLSWCDKYSNNLYLSHSNSYNNMNDQSQVNIRPNSSRGQSTNNNRESLLKYQLKLKEPDYTKREEFTIFCGTWNVNGKAPTEKLHEWLRCESKPPDIYAVGFQEIDLSKEAFLFNDTPREIEWYNLVNSTINHDKKLYHNVALIRLVGIQLIVFVKNEHYGCIKNVSVDTVGTGILGKMGNKGGVAVRFMLHNTMLCFVCSHLAAHVEEYERRNQDFKDIISRVNFKRHPLTVKEHDQIFWLGDLNYRINNMSTQEVKRLVNNNDFNALLKNDQLNEQRERGSAFVGFQEGEITFQPTYKFDVNSNIYDTSEKARPPAWTDRILWKGRYIHLVKYTSHMKLSMSDHKPVSAYFVSEISVIDEAKYKEIHEDLLRTMDKQENEYLPQVTIDKTEIAFDLVKFEEPQIQELIIANTGVVPAEFEFIKKLDDDSYCKDWLKILPYYGSINPGEKCDVKLEVTLKTNLSKLYDILVLHLKGGKDMFIILNGNVQKSCFFSPISMLCRIPFPIMKLNEEQWKQAESLELPIRYCIPREIFLLVDHLYRHGLKTKDLFESSSLSELVSIRDWLDFGSQDPMPGSVQAAAESLLLFLTHTQDPVIPYDQHDACIASARNYQNCKQIIIQKLPDLHRNVFLYICLFLQELLKHANENGFDAKTLALIFGDALLRDKILNSKPQASRGKSDFIYNFLVNDLSSAIIPTK